MLNIISRYAYSPYFLWVSMILLVTTVQINAEDHSPTVKRLIDLSKAKGAYDGSGLWQKDPFLPAEIPEALAYIKDHPDHTSYHLLLVLREHRPDSYKKVSKENVAAILCSSLKNQTVLNDFGTLDANDDSLDYDSAEVLIETGKIALKSLAPILDDDSPAILVGSQIGLLSDAYKYRRKDFAYRYAALILGEKPVFKEDIKERDKDIERLKKKLKEEEKKKR